MLLLFKKYLYQLRIKSRFFYGVTWNSLSRISAYDVSVLYCDVGICIVGGFHPFIGHEGP